MDVVAHPTVEDAGREIEPVAAHSQVNRNASFTRLANATEVTGVGSSIKIGQMCQLRPTQSLEEVAEVGRIRSIRARRRRNARNPSLALEAPEVPEAHRSSKSSKGSKGSNGSGKGKKPSLPAAVCLLGAMLAGSASSAEGYAFREDMLSHADHCAPLAYPALSTVRFNDVPEYLN